MSVGFISHKLLNKVERYPQFFVDTRNSILQEGSQKRLCYSIWEMANQNMDFRGLCSAIRRQGNITTCTESEPEAFEGETQKITGEEFGDR